ncbi:bZIP transcription factor TRAB1 [Hibiscus syriacus]|uniref:BZIP transcription factor TRAB1 n=1 Tax=Hibiscus syriacus TaxID=106335 RepID=A0A6A2WK76_HIBSY|nr:bZIP transcription factor TRAB1 [Hibiscus syriacus]
MGTNMNFKNFGSNHPPSADGGENKTPGNNPLIRQSSIYSLTFDEFQSTMGGIGKDFGSINMDELLRNIWSAEETQTMASSGGALEGNGGEYSFGKDGIGTGGTNNMPQRQQTLGEMTLEEFLVRAGVVREDSQLAGKASNLPSNVNGVRSNHHQLAQHHHQQQQPIFPKQTGVVYGAQMPLQSGGRWEGDGRIRRATRRCNRIACESAFVGWDWKSSGDTSSVSPVPYVFNGSLRGRKYSGVEKAAERRQRRMIKNRESAARSRARNLEYAFCLMSTEYMQMLSAYTMELEAEVAKLKEENQELRKKRAELMEMQKKEVIETNTPQGAKKRCLRRTQTGPW